MIKKLAFILRVSVGVSRSIYADKFKQICGMQNLRSFVYCPSVNTIKIIDNVLLCQFHLFY